MGKQSQADKLRQWPEISSHAPKARQEPRCCTPACRVGCAPPQRGLPAVQTLQKAGRLTTCAFVGTSGW